MDAMRCGNGYDGIKHTVSQQESDAIAKLYEQYDIVSQRMQQLHQSFKTLNESEETCVITINNAFTDLITKLQRKRAELLQQSREICHHKQNILSTQLDCLETYTTTILQDTITKAKASIYDTCTTSYKHKKQSLSLINDALNHQDSSLILQTSS
eukprot:732853_1